MTRWRRYRDLVDEWNKLYGRSEHDHLSRWAINPWLDERIADAFSALPLWLRVGCILRHPSCWRDAVHEVRHARRPLW